MGAKHVSDEMLLQQIAVGDRSAFSVLYRRHLDGVLSYARRRVPEPEIAFDIAAETFAVVAVNAEAYEGRGPAVGWIFGIARNQVATALRKSRVEEQARQRLGLEPIVLTDADLERVEERAAAGSEAMTAAVAALPEPIRQALLARIVDEHEYPEIAARMKCSQQVVRQRVHRGLSALRTTLGDQP